MRFVQNIQPVRSTAGFKVGHAEHFVRYLRTIQVSPNGHENSAKLRLLDKGVKYVLEACRTLFNFAIKGRHLPPYSDNPFSALELRRFRWRLAAHAPDDGGSRAGVTRRVRRLAVSTVSYDAANPIVMCARIPLPERVDTYLLLVGKFARLELARGSNMIWRMHYEPALLEPLAHLGAHDVYRNRARAVLDAVLDAMEAPVRQDLEGQRRKPVRSKRESEQAARLFLIEAFRRGPYFEQSEHRVYVRLISRDDSVKLLGWPRNFRRYETENDADCETDAWTGVDPF